MKKKPYQSSRIASSCGAIIFTLLFFYSAMANSDIETLFQKKTILSQKIDSLDILKQDLKRTGESVAELDQKQAQLRNSLDKIRDQIQQLAIANTKSGGKRHQQSNQFIQKPRTLFDWIIIIVGIIATFSGILLITGIVRNMARIGKDRKKQKGAVEKEPPATIHSAQPDIAYPYKTLREQTPSSEPSAAPATSPDMATLYALKKRISTTAAPPPGLKEQPQQIPVIEDATTSEPPPPQKPLPAVDVPLEQRVLEAARQGMDTATISRTFHISADHAALIVKMANSSHK